MARRTNEVKEKRRMSNFLFMLVCLLILGVFSALIFRQAASYNDLRAESIRIENQIAQYEAAYDAMRYRMAHFDSDAYIEQLARERLGWVRPNEIVFRMRTD